MGWRHKKTRRMAGWGFGKIAAALPRGASDRSRDAGPRDRADTGARDRADGPGDGTDARPDRRAAHSFLGGGATGRREGHESEEGENLHDGYPDRGR